MSRIRQCYSGIGGQAVLEGIMMKNKDEYSVAVRKPDGQIAVTRQKYEGILGDSVILKIPFVRGFFIFLDSMILGTRSLNYSAEFFDEETPEKKEKPEKQKKTKSGKEEKKKKPQTAGNGEKKQSLWITITTIIAVLFAVAVFVVLPYYLVALCSEWIRSKSLMALLEGVLRVVIFVLYIAAISTMKDIQRVYMYHGAEHKCINCIEKGYPLTVKNVMKSSRQHKRCGTSFMLYVMLISIVMFFFIRVDNTALKIILRIILIPVIAGISYELIRIAGRYDGWLVRGLSAAGMWLQGLTTKEPDEKMVEVAIAAVEEIFDWRAYQATAFGYHPAEDADSAEDAENAEDMDEQIFAAETENAEEAESEKQMI